jgi:hypothetical protein
MEYKWKQVQAGLPNNNNNITYGIGYWNGDWQVTAWEGESAGSVVAWTPLPQS